MFSSISSTQKKSHPLLAHSLEASNHRQIASHDALTSYLLRPNPHHYNKVCTPLKRLIAIVFPSENKLAFCPSTGDKKCVQNCTLRLNKYSIKHKELKQHTNAVLCQSFSHYGRIRLHAGRKYGSRSPAASYFTSAMISQDAPLLWQVLVR